MRRIDLGARPTSRDELASWYSAALEAQAASGVSVTDYAEQIGVTAATLYQWRRRLSSSSGDSQGRASLVEVTIGRPNTASTSGGMIVRLGDGRRSIEVPRSFDGDDLRRLVTLLESC